MSFSLVSRKCYTFEVIFYDVWPKFFSFLTQFIYLLYTIIISPVTCSITLSLPCTYNFQIFIGFYHLTFYSYFCTVIETLILSFSFINQGLYSLNHFHYTSLNFLYISFIYSALVLMSKTKSLTSKN